MDRERESIIELITSKQVTDAISYNAIRKENPLMAKLMLDKFKGFLINDYFTDIERQTILIKFFEEQQDLDIIRDVIKHVNSSEFSDDYIRIIMEWTLKSSEHIVNSNLMRFDGVGLCKSKKDFYSNNTTITEEKDSDLFLNALITLNEMELDDGTDEL